ncbi:hypothetical protein GQ457_15G001550 [Hibiscus cannabinus]
MRANVQNSMARAARWLADFTFSKIELENSTIGSRHSPFYFSDTDRGEIQASRSNSAVLRFDSWIYHEVSIREEDGMKMSV